MNRIVAIIGRPNVGKSTLFNRMIRKNRVITHVEPGMTRDRVYGACKVDQVCFSLVDTGGIMPSPQSNIEVSIREQVDFALEESGLILYVVDFSGGKMNVLDGGLLKEIRKKGKPIILIINKVDQKANESELAEFHSLGTRDICSVSAIHNRGIENIFELIKNILSDTPEGESVESQEKSLHVAVVGKPNVGKSSFINCLLEEKRLIVDDVPGTTRDAVDVRVMYKGESFTFIDTAGMRKKRKVVKIPESYSVARSLKSIRDARIVIHMIDTSEGLTEQDLKIIDFILREGRALVLVVNKWDTIKDVTQEKFIKYIDQRFRKRRIFDVLFMSVKEGLNVLKVFDYIHEIQTHFERKIATSIVNQVLKKATLSYTPPLVRGKRAKFYYATQINIFPPQFLIFVNDPKNIVPSYRQYLLNYVEERFGYRGVRVDLKYKMRPREDYPKVKRQKRKKGRR
ncbi:ribosome biogenesis GTPase Der [PVC group bacterium]|nr:ribosome biogenesis GTPase Der [PVC group bacterium]